MAFKPMGPVPRQRPFSARPAVASDNLDIDEEEKARKNALLKAYMADKQARAAVVEKVPLVPYFYSCMFSGVDILLRGMCPPQALAAKRQQQSEEWRKKREQEEANQLKKAIDARKQEAKRKEQEEHTKQLAEVARNRKSVRLQQT